MNNELREKLISMTGAESRARQTLTEGKRYDGYPRELEELHLQQAEELLKITNEHGWPGKSLAGKDGADAAFSLARHAISNPPLQKELLKHLEEAVLGREATALQEACLQDCILFNQGKPQRYGMCFDWDESGELVVNVEDVSQANERRKALGLKTLEEARLLHKTEIEQTGGPPKDIKEHQRQALAWAKRVGWRNA